MESGAFICIIATFLRKVTGQLFDMRKNYRAIFVQFYCILISEQGMQRKKKQNKGLAAAGCSGIRNRCESAGLCN